MIRKVNSYQTTSPIRSPLKAPMRPISPIRFTQHARQAPMSPLRPRISTNASRTPTRARPNQRTELTKSPINNKQNCDTTQMQRTLKNGVGLFQQLAHQIKIGSQKKQNKAATYNTTNPFDYSEKKRQTFGNYQKSSFAALIQNVKEIESIQASKGTYFNNQLSFKNADKYKTNDSAIKNQQFSKIKNVEHLNVIQSFGSPEQIKMPQSPDFKQKGKKMQKVTENQPSKTPATANQKPIPIVTSSFQDVILLIRKASEKVKDESQIIEEEVKMSIEDNNLSFNMSPFI